MAQFSIEQIMEGIELQKRLRNWRFTAVASLMLLVLFVFRDAWITDAAQHVRKHVARIEIQGFIFDDLYRMQSIAEIEKDKMIEAVIVHINSPGGSVTGGQGMYMALRKLSKVKPVVVVMGEIAASAGYMIALGGDYIIAYDGTLTGSIGVISETFEASALAEKIGVKFHTFRSGPFKGGPTSTEPLSEGMKESIEVVINDIYKMFVDMVVERRKISQEVMASIADGRVYTGRQALALKLIDELGNEDTARQWLKSKHNIDDGMTVLDYTIDRQHDRFEGFFRGIDSISNLLMKFTGGTFSL